MRTTRMSAMIHTAGQWKRDERRFLILLGFILVVDCMDELPTCVVASWNWPYLVCHGHAVLHD
jgi:hypothetical protein